MFPHKINVGIVASVRYSTTPNFVEIPFNLWDKCWRREGWCIPLCCLSAMLLELKTIFCHLQIGIYFNISSNSHVQRLGKFFSHKIFFYPTLQSPRGYRGLYNSMTQFLIINLCFTSFSPVWYYIFCIYAYIDRYSYTIQRSTYRCRVISMYPTRSAFLKNTN